jgi:beta-aspartyl-peptidase (threonine type)
MYALAIHAGAVALPRTRFSREQEQDYRHSLSTALIAGQQLLAQGGSALDAVEAAVIALEDNPLFNAGCGAVLCDDGSVELDAAIMSGSDLRAGAVAGIRHFRNPIRLARRIMARSAHVFLAGAGAETFADENGFERVPNEYFVTAYRAQQLRSVQRPSSPADPAAIAALDEPPLGTVGAVACDAYGRLAAATSTGGMAGKRRGRIGDSPVIGAGTYADDRSCAVSTTGHGEWFLRTVQAYDIAARVTYGGASLEDAVTDAIEHRLTRLGATGGLIALNQRGEIVMRFNTPAMFRACVREGEPPTIDID